MKNRTKREINCIRVNLNKKNNMKKANNISYVKIKENYDSYHKRNQELKILKENSTLYRKSCRNYLETKKENDIKDEKTNIEFTSLIPKKKVNNRKREEFSKIQRNVISNRRFEYSMKVKNAANIKKSKNYKYDLHKVIIIQKWIKGYLLRSFLCNASEVGKLINEFICHINKFIYFKFNFFKILKKYNFCNIKNINDNNIENKKYFSFVNDNISISNINTNNNTNTFTNNNTFSAGQETPEIFENRNRNRELLINPKRNYKAPSIRELLMVNSDLDKTKNVNKTINKVNKNEIYIKKLQKAKSLNHIKKNDNVAKTNNRINYKSNQILSAANIKLKENTEINVHKTGKVTNLRTLLFNNINNNNDEDKIYKKPLIDINYISKDSYYYTKNLINNSPKSEKLYLPKIYQLSLENNKENNNNSDEKNEKVNFGFEKIIIDEIKEVKEDEEDDSQSQILKNINTSFSQSQISEININNKNKNYNIDFSSSFQINPNPCLYDKKKILIVLLLQKQIKVYIKPYVYNILKNYLKEK